MDLGSLYQDLSKMFTLPNPVKLASYIPSSTGIGEINVPEEITIPFFKFLPCFASFCVNQATDEAGFLSTFEAIPSLIFPPL